jgi:hypothetical protein
MTTSTRIKGRALSLKLGATDYWADATNVVLDSEDPAVLTFYDASTAGRQYFFTIDAIQSTATGSFWSHVWANAGDDNVSFTYAPHGNATASATEPHFTGTLRIGQKPSIGGTAGVNSTFTFSTRFEINGEPALVTS